MCYSLKFREKVLEVKKEDKLTIEETQNVFHIGTATISRWLVKIELCVKRNKPATKIDMEELRKDIRNNPDDYQRERAKRFKVSQSCIEYALKRLKISYKKNSIPS